MKVLLTGGAGYIGSVTARALERSGHTTVLLDSLTAGARAFTRGRIFYQGDIADHALVRRIVTEHPDLAGCVHLAARTSVPESVADPVTYYRENVAKSLEFLQELTAAGIHRVVFSSSAAVYGPTPHFEVRETDPTVPASPYGRTKLMVEQILTDMAAAGALRAVSLRYFNPVGSDPDLECGVYTSAPSHVLGQLVRTALGDQPAFTLTGDDLPTSDGSGVRDYIHVWDVARAHVRALEKFDGVTAAAPDGHLVLNVGTGTPVTVRELHAAVQRVSGREIPLTVAPARAGDVAGAYANVDRAAQVLDWRAASSLDEAVASALAWAQCRERVLAGN